ncbi:hypothetical protein SAMN05421858_4036 [Haladaptatus litoreus]|uniref:Uncharacterized protein n=1 Tax=Haladaptatus litoreus TaxID=553468 RepID=A0A1N7E5J9_9EURY|nr:hypothetical protein [Haladaptatus litoreus]SIR83298.1 hypothetical protein SAMN05421858_4036 [Haladaptatus litoreus]
MAPFGYVVSAFVMGFLLVLLGVGLIRGRDWQQYATSNQSKPDWNDGEAEFQLLQRIATNSTVWVVCFLFLTLGIGAGAILFVSGTAVPASIRQSAWLALVSLSIVLVAGYIFWGTYQSIRYRGLDSAKATLTALWLWGMLFVVVVILQLVMA